ncbi:hypothetical protein COO60DRAFT_1699466 [Scenedesmus sp. NREL 46B-D3]|nr:hypothetical protein COO60DRAFT_1699466 [Scenedesmus sp. NREL 46B-D3]
MVGECQADRGSRADETDIYVFQTFDIEYILLWLQVALKRIPDVLLNSENAKRVLREVCILRRLQHPHIIGLKDVFLKPSSTGRYILDLYLALEFCDQGDLYHMRGQLSECEVRAIMLQLLTAVQYLHRNGVWHRDIKSANILMTYTNGVRHVKLADLGSARSTLLEKQLQQGAAGAERHAGGSRGSSRWQQLQHSCDGSSGQVQQQQERHLEHVRQDSMSLQGSHDLAQQQQGGSSKADEQGRHGSSGSGRLRPDGQPVHHSDSFCAEGGNASASEIYARPVAGGGGGFKAPLTRMVCTPCYRAPEVVMSRGGYTEAIDMWGCGCVFGELLQRVAWLGKATTPQLQVGPVFAIHGMPVTPVEGEHYAGPGSSVTRTELSALFAVIGTPSWRCIEGVDNPAWRRYLAKMPPRAPSLFRGFGSAGEVADLLPAMTINGAAALAAAAQDAGQQLADTDMESDEYKSGAPAVAGMRPVSILKRARSISGESLTRAAIIAAAGEVAAANATAAVSAANAAAGAAHSSDEPCVFAAAGAAAAADDDEMEVDAKLPLMPAACSSPSSSRTLPPLPPSLHATAATSCAACAAGGSPARPAGAGDAVLAVQGSFAVTRSGQHYYELDDPAAALAALEHDMAALMMSLDMPADVAPGGPTPQAPQPLRELLEREVADHKAHLERRRATAPLSHTDSPGARSPVKPMSPLLLGATAKRMGPGGLAGVGSNGSIVRQWQHLQPDPGASVDASKIGMQRVPHHADAEQARLEPEQHLRAGRHGEWMQDTLQAGTRRGDVWGVSLVPSGYSEEAHPELANIIRSQHKR